MVVDWVIALALMVVAGLFIGTISAMLGIGGGMIMVPALLVIFLLLDIPDDIRMHVAAGTALCIMLATSAGSVVSHARRHNIVWTITWRVLPSMAVGVVAGAILADALNGEALRIVFAIVLIVVSCMMIFGFRVTPGERRIPKWSTCLMMGSGIGFKSGLLGVGGGALSVPWLTFEGLRQSDVSGTSASFTPCAAVIGTIAFIITGWSVSTGPGMIGFVFWPALPAAGAATLLGAFFGAKLANQVPGRELRLIFGILVLCVAISMLVF